MRDNAGFTLHSEAKLNTRTIPDHAHTRQPGETNASQDNRRGNSLRHAALCCAGSEHPTFVCPTTGGSFAAKVRGTCEDACGLRDRHTKILRQYRARQRRDAQLSRVASKRSVRCLQGSESGTCCCTGQRQKLKTAKDAPGQWSLPWPYSAATPHRAHWLMDFGGGGARRLDAGELTDIGLRATGGAGY